MSLSINERFGLVESTNLNSNWQLDSLPLLSFTNHVITLRSSVRVIPSSVFKFTLGLLLI